MDMRGEHHLIAYHGRPVAAERVHVLAPWLDDAPGGDPDVRWSSSD
jgi:hypothetical protein